MSVRLVWSTPNGEEHIAYMARVSNPNNQSNPDYAKLIQYLVKHQHWSPFEMVNICMEIETTRDIARQILRHRSFTFQEFSQRYAEIQGNFCASEARLQDPTNRQNSIENTDKKLADDWFSEQSWIIHEATIVYERAIRAGIAKEVARKVLPEGLTMSKMYMNGTLRSWMHYVTIRCNKDTQKEHRDVAMQCKDILTEKFPIVMKALNG
jgi:thymidylate synthase (FAD)